MAFLNYEYKMKITYSEPVGRCHFTIKSIPADDFRQRSISYSISITPPAQYSKSQDSFGNIPRKISTGLGTVADDGKITVVKEEM